MLRSSLAAAFSAVLAAGIAQSAAAQEAAEQRLGAVHFETSCNDAAQRRFDRGMRYQHSFWYRASKEIFEDTLKADPDCAIAYWGIATSLLLNPFGVPPAANLAKGLAAIQKAKAIGAKTPRENEFIGALGAFYTDYDKLDHRTRVQAYLKAMAALAQRYPQDDEAQIYYALALDVAASPADKTYANQLKAAAILEDIFKRQPQHPGVAHYLIHSYDYPPIADKGLDAATRYSKIAPTAPHAQHMPSHIFTRVGYWKESIAANSASVRAAKADKEYGDQLHGQDYMVYAYLQLAQDKNARAVIDEMAAGTAVNPDLPGASFALAASPARYAMERGIGRRRRARGEAQQVPACHGDHPFRPRGGRGPRRQARRGQGRHRQAGGVEATSCARPRTPTGPSRSISSGRPRMRGCFTRRANTTRRSPPGAPRPPRTRPRNHR
jgi:hypothetical protein